MRVHLPEIYQNTGEKVEDEVITAYETILATGWCSTFKQERGIGEQIREIVM